MVIAGIYRDFLMLNGCRSEVGRNFAEDAFHFKKVLTVESSAALGAKFGLQPARVKA